MDDNERMYSDEGQLKLKIQKKRRELLAMMDQDNDESSCSECSEIKCSRMYETEIAEGYINLMNNERFKAPPAALLPKPKWTDMNDEESIKSSIPDKKDRYQNVVALLNSYQIDKDEESIVKGKSLLSLIGVIPSTNKNPINGVKSMATKSFLFPSNGVIPPIGTRRINGLSSISKEGAHVSSNSAIPPNHQKINDERKIPNDTSMFKWIDQSYPTASEISSSSLFSYDPNSDETQTTSDINKITKYYTLF